jgi:hypothetical protein
MTITNIHKILRKFFHLILNIYTSLHITGQVAHISCTFSTLGGNIKSRSTLSAYHLKHPKTLKTKHLQWYLGLRVTWSASVLQDEQKFLINFNLINERGLAIRVLLSAERHMITSRSGLWVIISHARSQSAYLICIVNIRASVVTMCMCVKHFLLCPYVVTVLY